MAEDTLVGQMARITDPESLYHGKIGELVYKAQWYGTEADTYRVDFSDDWGYFSVKQFEIVRGVGRSGCECGSSACGSSKHSYYCKLYKEED